MHCNNSNKPPGGGAYSKVNTKDGGLFEWEVASTRDLLQKKNNLTRMIY